MGRLTLWLAATLLMIASPLPATAQIKLDMNRITCKAWLGYSPGDRDFVRYWMSGYYNAAANSSVLDYNRLQKNSANVTAYCRKNQSETLPTAISKVAR